MNSETFMGVQPEAYIRRHGKAAGALAKSVRMLEKLHAEDELATPEDSKQVIDSMNFDEFMRFISTVNGVERGISHSERGVASGSYIRSSAPGKHVEYLPPASENRKELLEEAFHKAQVLEDPEAAALTLGLSVNAIHYFLDGNGRVSRTLYTLLTKGYDGSTESKKYYSDILENTKGRKLVDISTNHGGLGSKLFSEIAGETRQKYGYTSAFGDKAPSKIDSFYSREPRGESSPNDLRVGKNVDDRHRLMLFQTLEGGGTEMTAIMRALPPERVKKFVKSKGRGYEQVNFLIGKKFIPSLTNDEIEAIWTASNDIAIDYVRKVINITDRNDYPFYAKFYRDSAAP